MTTPAIMLGLLAGPLLLSIAARRLTGRVPLDAQTLGCAGIALLFCFTGVGHFIKADEMAKMLPDWTPAPVQIVYFTGVVELIAAGAVLVPRFRIAIGWGLIVMLAMFLPVNVFAAMNRVEFGGHEWGPAYLWIRVPLQAILVGWIWRFAVRPTSLEPIRFSCEATFRMAAEEIAAGILDLSKWPEFEGYGVLPGVKSATFELKTPEIVGTRIRATDRDGSTHVEEIVEWAPDRQIKLRMSDFSPPLSRIATCFEETWLFDRQDDRTQAVRQFALFPKSAVARPPLWVVAQLLKRAIARHLVQMKRSDQ